MMKFQIQQINRMVLQPNFIMQKFRLFATQLIFLDIFMLHPRINVLIKVIVVDHCFIRRVKTNCIKLVSHHTFVLMTVRFRHSFELKICPLFQNLVYIILVSHTTVIGFTKKPTMKLAVYPLIWIEHHVHLYHPVHLFLHNPGPTLKQKKLQSPPSSMVLLQPSWLFG